MEFFKLPIHLLPGAFPPILYPFLFDLFARRANHLERQGYDFSHRKDKNGRELQQKPHDENKREHG